MRKLIVATSILGLAAITIVAVLFVRPASAANNGSNASHASGSGAVTVTQGSIDSVHWSTNDTSPGGTVSFVPGPVPAPLGAGSLHLTTNSSSAKAQLLTSNYYGTSLLDLTNLSYSDYRSSASTNSSGQRVSLNIEVYARGGTSGFTTLVYEPIYQAGGLGALHDDTWQTWSTLGSGVWWSTRTVSGTSETLHGSRDGNPDYWTWQHITAQFPNATIILLGFNIGSGWTGQFSGNADALAVGVSGNTTTYNFEPDTSACKDGGWQAYGFKNQGDCVSYVATGGKNPGN